MEKLKMFFLGICTAIILIAASAYILSINGVINLDYILPSSFGSKLYTKKVDNKAREITALVDQYYIEDVSDEKIADGISAGILAGTNDKYAGYYNGNNVDNLYQTINGSFTGIGVTVSKSATTGAVIISEVHEGYPAKEAGLKKGDTLISVAGHSVEGLTLDEISGYIKGEEGTSVELIVRRRRRNIPITCKRAVIKEEEVTRMMLPKKTGYIRVKAFSKVTEEQFREALELIKTKNPQKLIIDLRDNGGGVVDVAVAMADMLIAKGETVAYTLDKSNTRIDYKTKDDEELSVPIFVLVNSHTASASELFTGALADIKNAVIVGTKTYGKGVVQTTFTLSDHTAIKLTTAKYYTPKGRCIDGTGIEPDKVIENADTCNISDLLLNKRALINDWCVNYALSR